MSFQPVVPLSGYVGWRFLERTLENQQAAYAESEPIARATDYFRENIADIGTAEDLVADRRLLSVALGAFGLDDDIDNKFFIQQILEDGTLDEDSLANRLTDTRYADFSSAFGFGDSIFPSTSLPSFPDEIVDRFEARQFERAVGNQDNDLRLAMNIESGISDIVSRTDNTDAQWFSVMGNGPLLSVFQTALGLPSSIANVNLDQQLEIYQSRSNAIFGTDQVADFLEPEQQEDLIRLFLIRSEAANISAASSGSTALALLQSAPRLF